MMLKHVHLSMLHYIFLWVYILYHDKAKEKLSQIQEGIYMKLRKIKVKLTEKDKLTLMKYINICTDLPGNGCSIKDLDKETSKLILN